jgi:hypothetical protein
MGAIFLVSGLPLLLGVFILSRFLMFYEKGVLRSKWPSVTGTIIISEIKEGYSGDGEYSAVSYNAIISYRYTVNLVEYVSSVISSSEPPFAIGKKWYAKSQVDKYKVKKQVSVFYNPEDPREAVLENPGGLTSGTLFLLLLGISLIVWSIWFLILVN